jgi:hypothetical protein
MPSVCLGERANCVDLFRKKAFVRAADCFEGIAKKLGDSASLSVAAKSEKGQFLRNAAVALDKAADIEKWVEVAAFLRERAVRLLQQYQKEQLYETENRKQTALAQQASIHKKIGYASLAIVTNNTQASISLEGYRFAQRAMGNLNQSMRPGVYKITVMYPGKSPIIREIHIIANKSHSENFQPAASVVPPVSKEQLFDDTPQISQKPSQPPSPAMPTLSWFGYIGGGVMVVAGSVMLGIGASQWFAINSEHEDQKKQNKDINFNELMERRDHAQRFIWPGTALLGTGVILAIVGVAKHITAPRRATAASLPSAQFPQDHSNSKPVFQPFTQTQFEYIIR